VVAPAPGSNLNLYANIDEIRTRVRPQNNYECEWWETLEYSATLLWRCPVLRILCQNYYKKHILG